MRSRATNRLEEHESMTGNWGDELNPTFALPQMKLFVFGLPAEDPDQPLAGPVELRKTLAAGLAQIG
jgi:hypothetical protein